MASVFPLQCTTELALQAFLYMQDSAFGCEQKKKKSQKKSLISLKARGAGPIRSDSDTT